jgi:hypothetical protein
MAEKIEIKEFTTNCSTSNGGSAPVTLYLGYPSIGNHPLANQNRALSNRGYSIPEHVMESFKKLADIAEKNNIPFIELCDYVIKEVEIGKSVQEDLKKASEISEKQGPNTDQLNNQSQDNIEIKNNQNDYDSAKNLVNNNDQINNVDKTNIESFDKNLNLESSTQNINIENNNNNVENNSANDPNIIKSNITPFEKLKP